MESSRRLQGRVVVVFINKKRQYAVVFKHGYYKERERERERERGGGGGRQTDRQRQKKTEREREEIW